MIHGSADMRRISRYILPVFIFIFLLVGLFVHNRRRSIMSGLHLDSQAPTKITIIAVWSIRGPSPKYLPYFFQSVEANEQVDLLFVQLDLHGRGCPSYSMAPNVKELCLTMDEYFGLHVSFLCKRWKCSADERDVALESIKENGEYDPVNTNFRILRAGVFAPYIDPATTIWGWCDVDEYWGNLSRTFPWDVAPEFDVLTPSSQPDFANYRMLFTRGHMTFIRNSPDVLHRLHSFPKFSSLSAYLSLPPTLPDAEESEFSHYIFSDDPSFTFLTFEGMLDTYDTALLSPRGVFYTSMQKEDLQDPDRRKRLAALVCPVDKMPTRRTFSDEGVEEEARVHHNGYHYPGDLWFDRKYVTFVETGWLEPAKREQKAYFIRRKPYGPVVQRLEPRARFLRRDGELVVDECLYKHWQVEKHEHWFGRISDIPDPGKIFVQHDNAQVDIWNEYGDIVYTTGS